MRRLAAILLLAATGALAQPLIDYHQHFFHAVEGLPDPPATVNADNLVALLDAAGIRRALVLSVAYQFSNPNRPPVPGEYAKVRAENDWTSAQVARYPDRLRAFCSVNPIRDYAIPEIQRCAQNPQMRHGIKLHFGNSDVELDNPDHVQRVRRVFGEANRRGMAIVVHVRSSITSNRSFGAKEARTFLTQVLPAAPRVPVQIAHLCGNGDYDASIDAALGVLVDAIEHHDRRTAHVYFDASGIGAVGNSAEMSQLIAARIRQIGLGRVLFGSDGAIPGNTPLEYWTRFRRLPLTDAEFRTVEASVAPYMKW